MLFVAGSANWALSTVRSRIQEDPESAVALDRLMTEMGPWTGELADVDQAIVKRSPGLTTRTFVFREAGSQQLIWVAISMGPPGLVTEELPEKTYRFVGYAYDNESRRIENLSDCLNIPVEGQWARMNFWARGSVPPLRVWQSWFDGKQWSRPDLARWRFLDRPALAKVQIWYQMLRPNRADADQPWVDPGKDFLRVAIPTISRELAFLGQSWSAVLTR
jgi:hypothetical protein